MKRDRADSTEPPDRAGDPGGGFLERWSRRKRDPAPEDPAPEDPAPKAPSPQAPPGVGEEPGSEVPEQEAALALPSLDELDVDGDYSAFMSPKVDQALRRTALRKLFSNPVFNVVDGLDDYDDDFTGFEALGDLITADMRHEQELEAQRLAEARREGEEGVGEAPETVARADSASEPAPDDETAREEGEDAGEEGEAAGEEAGEEGGEEAGEEDAARRATGPDRDESEGSEA